jgi:hypothetical protein
MPVGSPPRARSAGRRADLERPERGLRDRLAQAPQRGLDEIISPELALVDPVLGARARALLPGPGLGLARPKRAAAVRDEVRKGRAVSVEQRDWLVILTRRVRAAVVVGVLVSILVPLAAIALERGLAPASDSDGTPIESSRYQFPERSGIGLPAVSRGPGRTALPGGSYRRAGAISRFLRKPDSGAEWRAASGG